MCFKIFFLAFIYINVLFKNIGEAQIPDDESPVLFVHKHMITVHRVLWPHILGILDAGGLSLILESPPHIKLCEIYTYHIISYHIISYHIISYHIISYHIISYHIISYHIISYHIISYHIISYHIISYHIISYHIISYHIISYHIISYHIYIYIDTYLDIYRHVQAYVIEAHI